MSKQILVTGGAGFLGSYLCRCLLNEDYEVIRIDNFFTGEKRNIVHLMNNPYFEVIRHDIIFSFSVEVDEIYNLACPASPIHYQFDPVQTTKTSVMGAINVLDLAKMLNAKILPASTSEVYGDPQVHPRSENYRGNVNSIGSQYCYNKGKCCAETLSFDYNRHLGLNLKVIHIFNIQTSKMYPSAGRVISGFGIQELENEDITLSIVRVHRPTAFAM